MFYSEKYESPIGPCLLVADENNLVGVWFEGQKYYCPMKESIQKDDNIQEDAHNYVLRNTKAWLDSYFAGKKPAITELPLKPIGSSFRQDVWSILMDIPYGKVITYGEIAGQIAETYQKEKMSAQAVGGAVGHNPISIIIPCHRVVGADGSLTGYAGGLQKKLWLLRHEGAMPLTSVSAP